MLIVHSLNTNFTYHLHCPLCGSSFLNIKRLEQLSRYKKRLLQDKRIIFKDSDGVDKNSMRLEKRMKCSKCPFEILYTLDLRKEIKRVN